MPLVVPNNGEADMLAAIVNKTAAQDLVLKLFTSDTTPAESDTTATYTECSAAGYAAIDLAGASWTVTEGAPSVAAYPQQTFALTAAATVYGYYVVRKTSGKIAWAERFSGAPFVLPSGGGTIKVTPQLTLD